MLILRSRGQQTQRIGIELCDVNCHDTSPSFAFDSGDIEAGNKRRRSSWVLHVTVDVETIKVEVFRNLTRKQD